MTDAWTHEADLARSTLAWGAGSVLAGLALGVAGRRRGNAWLAAFGLQNAGWGAVDVAIAAVAERLRARRMDRLPDPQATVELRREAARLRRVLLVNVGLDAGYVVGGAALWRWRRRNSAAAGASAGIVLQGAFLLVHDSVYAARLR